VYPPPWSRDSPVYSSAGGRDSPVINTLGSLYSFVLLSPEFFLLTCSDASSTPQCINHRGVVKEHTTIFKENVILKIYSSLV
jgi:hypothetical protein